MAENEQVFVVGGIAFTDMEQAKLAQNELKRIEILNQKLDYNNMPAVAMVYEKSRANHIFKTPIGLSYMMRLQNVLVQHNYEGINDKPILMSDMQQMNAAQQQQNPHWEEIWKSRLDVQKEKEKKLRGKYRMAIIGNIALALLVLLLFVISQTGKNPTVLNYKSKILNQYTSWEQELDEREQAIKEKEAALDISEP